LRDKSKDIVLATFILFVVIMLTLGMHEFNLFELTVAPLIYIFMVMFLMVQFLHLILR